MTWNLNNAQVDLHGFLNVSPGSNYPLLTLPLLTPRKFKPDIQYWLDPNNTYRVVFIQSQASWFVVTGRDFTIDAHNEGGIIGNGQVKRFYVIVPSSCSPNQRIPYPQPWWEYFQSHTRADGDGRPLSLTLSHVQRATVRNFHIDSPPFWCNTVADSVDVVYDGMKCNATNGNVSFAGMK